MKVVSYSYISIREATRFIEATGATDVVFVREDDLSEFTRVEFSIEGVKYCIASHGFKIQKEVK